MDMSIYSVKERSQSNQDRNEGEIKKFEMTSVIVSSIYHLKHWPGSVPESHGRTWAPHHPCSGCWVKIAQIPSLFAWYFAVFNLIISSLEQNKGFIIRFKRTLGGKLATRQSHNPQSLAPPSSIMLESKSAAYITLVQSHHIQRNVVFTYTHIISAEIATRYRACYFSH